MVDKTVFSLGKSLMPASRMEMEESSSASDERREVTEELSEALLEVWAIAARLCVSTVKL